MKRWLKWIAGVLCVLGVAAVGAGYWWMLQRHPGSQPFRKLYCSSFGCPTAKGLDRLCGLFSEAEFVQAGADKSAVQAWVKSEYGADDDAWALVAQAFASGDIETLEEEAYDAGGVVWICPAIKRAVNEGS